MLSFHLMQFLIFGGTRKSASVTKLQRDITD